MKSISFLRSVANHHHVALSVVALLLVVFSTSSSTTSRLRSGVVLVVHANNEGSSSTTTRSTTQTILLRPKMHDMVKLKKQYIESGVSEFASFNIYTEYLRQKGEFPYPGYITGFEKDTMLDVMVDTEDVSAMPKNGRALGSSMDLRPISSHCVQVKCKHLNSLVELIDHAIENPGLVKEIRQTRLENLALRSLHNYNVKEIHGQEEDQRKRNLSSPHHVLSASSISPALLVSQFPLNHPIVCADEEDWKTSDTGLTCAQISDLFNLSIDTSLKNRDFCSELSGIPYKGKTTIEACCVCGGGKHRMIAPSVAPSVSSQPSQTPSNSPTECIDDPGWQTVTSVTCDDIKTFNRELPEFQWCKIYGDYPTQQSATIFEACCDCGGGIDFESSVPSSSSVDPTLQPSAFPTTTVPSEEPTNYPTKLLPTTAPSLQPSKLPSTTPSYHPTYLPTGIPSTVPTRYPSDAPTNSPSADPSTGPTAKPSVFPTDLPSANPSLQPSTFPTTLPSEEPTNYPTILPSITPSVQPSNSPSTTPSDNPTYLPTGFPSTIPTRYPSDVPSNSPRPSSSPLPIPDIPQFNTGDVIAEARYSHRLNEIFETYGIVGQSIRIGVLSDSVDYITELVDRGELPNDVTIESESDEPGSEGTAMLEVVYDVCPGCKLFFATSWTGMEPYANNIRQLYDKHRCQVIIAETLYFAEAYFQDDIIAQAVDYVSSKGVFFYSYAGNNGNSFSGVKNTYIGDWNPEDFIDYEYNNAHRFSNETGYLNPLKITTSDVGETIFTLHYSEPLGAVKIDLDFFILDENQYVMTSSLLDNIKSGQPYEIFQYTPTSKNSLFVAQYISEGFSTTCQKLHILAYDPHVELEHYSDPLRNIYGSAAASSAISVGSVLIVENEGFDEFTDIASYSAEGPSENCFDKDGNRTVTDGSSDCIERAAPTITAGSGVSVTTPGYQYSSQYPLYYGTQVSAAVAGAITAVLLEAFPDLDRNQLLDAYKETSIDILSEGFDTASGYGIVDALALFEFILDKQTTCSSYAECPAGTVCTCLSDGTCYCKAEVL
jgi:Uncharacterized protein conserved in bacteria